MCAIQIDGNDGSDADEHKDSRYFLTKIDKKERLGERENGKPVKFFDDSDVGILQSNVFLQDLPASEFKEGSDGSLNSKWANYLKNGTEKYIIPGMPVDLGWELTWNTSFNGTELEIAKETEKSWAQSHLDAWTTIGVFLADFTPFKIGDSITKVGMDFTLSDQFISVQNTILNNTDELNENNIGTKDGLFSTLEKIISDSTNLSELPGEADTIILSKYKYHEAGISPGNIIDIINEIIGDKDTVDSNLANFSSINSFIQSFKNAFEANIGYIVSNEPMGVKYTHKENTEEIYYSDPKAASYNNEEVLPEGENLEDYDSEIYKFPVFDDFRENIFGEVKGGDTIVSGIQYINELIKNKSLINLVDTPTGYIGHSGEYLIVNTGESGIYFTGIEKIAQDLTDYGFIGGDGITGFTELYDTPTGYQEHSGHYLVVNDGETGVHFTGIEKIAQDLTNYGFVGGEGSNHFTGLQDTPSDYNSGHYLRSTDNGIEYAEPSELGQDVLTNTTGLASGYLRIDDDGTGIVIVGRETFKGEIDLQTDFTGLQDTPSDYSEGDYLRSTSNGLEYVTTSGLAQDIGDEIVNNIVTGDLLGFTGLNDTPTGYETGKFVRVNSAGDAVEYSDISFLNDVIDAPESQLVSGFLKLDKDGKLVWSPATTDGDVSFTITGATHFTGLLDTPNTYDNNKFLAFDAFKNQITGVELKLASSFYGPADVINNPHDLSEVGDKKILEYHRTQEHGYEIKWVDQITGITTFSGLNGTPADYQEGKYLRSTADGLEYVDITGLAEEVSAEIDFPEGATGFTGLHDTPADYQEGKYLRSTADGLEYVDITGLAEEVSAEIDFPEGATGFTGLHDTPADYQEGKYLRSTADGLEYVGITGLAEEVSAEIDFPEGATGFTGLHDTPIDYINASGKFVRVQSNENGLEYSNISFLQDIIDAPESELISGYLKLDEDRKLVWSAATTDGDVSYTITGATHFTGLVDTPTDYQEGKYLRSTADGLEYVDITGLAEEVSAEIDFPEGATGFTGLHDTPADYQEGKYLRSTADGLEYVDITGLAEEVSAEIDFPEGATGFTGLHDTPADYQEGKYLRSTADGLEYVDITGLAEEVSAEIDFPEGATGFTGLHDTPADYQEGKYLRSTADGLEYVDITGLAEEVSAEIDFPEGATGFTGLHDTPADYQEGKYLRSTADGLEYVDITGLAEEVSAEIDFPEGATGFTGLHDTPADYQEGKYLRSTADGLEYVDITGLAEEVSAEIDFPEGATGFTGLHDTPIDYINASGKFVRVQSNENGLEYSNISFLQDIIDAPESELISGYLKLDEDRKLVWSAATTDGDVSYTITGATHFTGLVDTPTDYQEGKYLRSTADGLEYVDITGLAEEVSAEIDFPEGATGFTGLHDTPADYQEGKYLRSTADGLEYVDITGLAEEVSAEIDFPEGATGFTGLHDTPADYQEGKYLRSTADGLEYVGITGLAEEVSAEIDFPEGATGFTGLHDTPADYQEGKYLRSTADGLEYVDITGLAEEVSAEIDFPEGATGFTGLHDTPIDYINASGKFVRVQSNENGLEYSNISFLQDIIDAPESELISGYLKLDEDRKLVWSAATTDGDVSYTITGATHFTGLVDTPTDYQEGKYLRSTADGLEYVDITGLAEEVSAEIDFPEGATGFTGLHDTPADYQEGKYLRSTADGLEYVDITGLAEEVSAEIDFPEGATGFTGLNDTPTGYLGHSGDYLVVNDNESGIHFTGIEKIAADLTDYGFGGGGGSSTIPSYTDLPDVTENDGKIVASGCELYHSCDGEWTKIIKQDTITTLPPGESDGLPGCVASLKDKTNYIIYKDEVITENASNTFSLSLQGLSSPQLHEACLFTEFQGVPDNSIKLNFAESDYQWAIAPDSLLHPQVHYDSPTATQVFTLNNSDPYNQFNSQSMPLRDEFIDYPSQISDMHFSEDGLRAIGFGYQSLYVHEYLFTQPYDLSTGTRSKFKQIQTQSSNQYYSNLFGRLGVVTTDDPSVVYVYYHGGIERKTLDTPGDLYSINPNNDWYARNAVGNSQDSYFGYYQRWYDHNNRYDLASMDFTNNGSTLIVLFKKNYKNNTDDKLSYLVSYDLETPYLLPGNMPHSPTTPNQVVDEFLPEPSAVVDLDSFGSLKTIGNRIFGNGKYILLQNNTNPIKHTLLEMGVPGDLNTLFTKGEIQANPALGYVDNLFSSQTTVFPKNNLDLFMFSSTDYNTLVSSSLSSPRGQLDESSCQFVEWKTSEQSLISNSSNPSNAQVTFNKDLSITGVFNCN